MNAHVDGRRNIQNVHVNCVIYGQLRMLSPGRRPDIMPGHSVNWAKSFPTKYKARVLERLESMWPRAVDWQEGFRMTTAEERAFHPVGITRVDAPGWERNRT